MRLLHLWLCLILLIFVGPAWAQTSTPTATTTPTASPTPTASASSTPTPQPMGIGDISSSAQAVQAELRDIDTQLQNDQQISTIQSSLPLLTREITARLADNTRVLQGHPSLDTLRQLEADWTSLGQDFPTWQTELTTRGAALDAQLTHLDQEDASWKTTLTSVNSTLAGNSTTAPKTTVDTSVTSLIQSLVTSIEQTSAALTQRQGQIFILQTAVALQASRVSEALASVSKIRDQTVIQVFVQDSPPLWAAGIRAHIQSGLLKEIGTSGSGQMTALLDYLQLKFGRLVLQACVFLLL